MKYEKCRHCQWCCSCCRSRHNGIRCSGCENMNDEFQPAGNIIYCPLDGRMLFVDNLPKEFKFKSNINTLVSWYHAVEKEDCYVVTSDSGCMWNFDKDEIRGHLLKGDYEIIEEETK